MDRYIRRAAPACEATPGLPDFTGSYRIGPFSASGTYQGAPQERPINFFHATIPKDSR